MGEKKIVVIFPGENYSTDCPLLYYAGFEFQVRGYEKIAISYSDFFTKDKSIDECVKDIKNAVLTQLQTFDLSQYDDIVFVSKSIGTVIAGWVQEKLFLEATHIFLTPIKQTLPYIRNGKNIKIVVAGTKDKHLEADILKEHCIKENVCLKQIDGVGHRLELWGDMDKNIEVLKEVIALY